MSEYDIYDQILRTPEEISKVTDETTLLRCIRLNPKVITYITNPSFLTTDFLISLLKMTPHAFKYFKDKHKLNSEFIVRAIRENKKVVEVFDKSILGNFDLLLDCVLTHNDLLVFLFDEIEARVRRDLIEIVKIDYSLYIDLLKKNTLFLLAYIPEDKLEANIDVIINLFKNHGRVLVFLPLSFLTRHFDKFAEIPNTNIQKYLLNIINLPYSLRRLWLDHALRIYGLNPMIASGRDIQSRLVPYRSCLKSVTILINLHGGDLETMLSSDLPWNTATAVSIGLLNSSILAENILAVLSNHKRIKTLYEENNIKNSNLLLSELEFGYIADAYDYLPLHIQEQKDSCPHLKARYEMWRYEHNYLRSYSFDRKYTVEKKDVRQYYGGIYVIHTTHPEMMPTFNGKLTHLDLVNNFLPDHNCLLQYNALQERNLFNVDVSLNIEEQKRPYEEECFDKGVTIMTPDGLGYITDMAIRNVRRKNIQPTDFSEEGIELYEMESRTEYKVRIKDVDRFYTKDQLSRPTIKEGKGLGEHAINLNGLLKYNEVKLSSILHYFQRLGFDHVNLIDSSCRPSKLTPELQRRKSMTEKTKYKEFGGKKTVKNKRKRKTKTKK